ncbi:hypothetical protein ABIA00_005456 [Bradyrhizobium ottawaense]
MLATFSEELGVMAPERLPSVATALIASGATICKTLGVQPSHLLGGFLRFSGGRLAAAEGPCGDETTPAVETQQEGAITY